MSNVRDHLVARLEELGEREADAHTIARARATAEVASKFIDAVKVEIDARRLLSADGLGLPPALEAPQDVPAIGAPRARA